MRGMSRMPDIPGFCVLSRIGSGSYSTVYSAMHPETGMQCALKRIGQENFTTQEELNIVLQEAAVHKRLDHVNIARYFGIVQDGESLIMVMELVNGASLLELINSGQVYSDEIAKTYFRQLVSAVAFMHLEKGVIHRDIKLDNILVDECGVVKLIDFGFSHDNCDVCSSLCGTYPYASPELLAGKTYSGGVDIWSIGVVLYAMLYKAFPFDSVNVPEMIQKIQTDEPHFAKGPSPYAIDLMKKMLTKDPSKRITIQEIMSHPWLGGVPSQAKRSDVQAMVDWEMEQMGRTAVDPDGDSYDAMIYRMIKFRAEKFVGSIHNPLLDGPESSIITKSMVLPAFQEPSLTESERTRMKRRQMSDDSVWRGVKKRSLAPMVRTATHGSERRMVLDAKPQRDFSNSMCLPPLTFV